MALALLKDFTLSNKGIYFKTDYLSEVQYSVSFCQPLSLRYGQGMESSKRLIRLTYQHKGIITL